MLKSVFHVLLCFSALVLNVPFTWAESIFYIKEGIGRGSSPALRVEPDGATAAFLEDSSPAGAGHYIARFWVRLDRVVIENGSELSLLAGLGEDNESRFRLAVGKVEGSLIAIGYVDSGQSIIATPAHEIEPFQGQGEWHLFGIEWSAAFTNETNDGTLTLSVDGSVVATVSELANSAHALHWSRLGVVEAVPGVSGSIDIDDFESSVDYLPALESQDRDNDGVPDVFDTFPDDPVESIDTDGDGRGNNADLDDDNDGLSDADELSIHMTNPLRPDTDGDGYSDKDEVDAGTDPLSAEDAPIESGLNIIVIKAAIDAKAE